MFSKTALLLNRTFKVLPLILLLVGYTAQAATVQTVTSKNYSNAELDQMLAPIALYPDALLAEVLMAATYSSDVARAGRWLESYPDLRGEAAQEAAKSFDWHVSVKALLAFPDVLQTMYANTEWTVKLGMAFEAQKEEILERIQFLRHKAMSAGNLESNSKMNVVAEDDTIIIEPVSEEVIYVPYYNPAIIYGAWWWPTYSPYYWGPWHGYAYYPGYSSVGFMWGPGIWISYTRFYGRFDWKYRHVHWNYPSHHHRNGYPEGKSKPDEHERQSGRPGNRVRTESITNRHRQNNSGSSGSGNGNYPGRERHEQEKVLARSVQRSNQERVSPALTGTSGNRPVQERIAMNRHRLEPENTKRRSETVLPDSRPSSQSSQPRQTVRSAAVTGSAKQVASHQTAGALKTSSRKALSPQAGNRNKTGKQQKDHR